MICVNLVGYDVVRFGSDFGQILVRFLGKIGQIVSPIFCEFWSDLEIIYTADSQSDFSEFWPDLEIIYTASIIHPLVNKALDSGKSLGWRESGERH